MVHPESVRTPIDAFILQKLETKNLSFSPEADRLKLCGRAYLDLIGMPPKPAEMEAYLTDPRSDAYERMIDRLLDSPQYGERWGQYWLNAAGYSDSEGIIDEDLIRPHAPKEIDLALEGLQTLTKQWLAHLDVGEEDAPKTYTARWRALGECLPDHPCFSGVHLC